MALLTAEQAARRLGVKVETVYAYVSRGALARQRATGSRASWFDADDVERLARRGRPRRSTRPVAIDVPIESAITSITDHVLRYRQHDAATLARTTTFEQVAELLWTGVLPATFSPWETTPPGRSALPTALDTLRQAVVVAGAHDALAGDLRPEAVAARARAILAAMAGALPAPADVRVPRLDLGDGPLRATVAGRLWARLAGGRARPDLLRALNAALVLFADHELAPSTLAARVAASTRADPYSVVLAGLGPLAGRLHGRASRDARRLLDTAAADGAGAALAEALAAHGGYPGFGHPLYPEGDPRARVLLDLVGRASAGADVVAVVDDVVATVRRHAAVEPNVDFALAALTAASGMRPEAGEVIFAIGRSAGWLAHALEEYEAPPLRFRARAVHTPNVRAVDRPDP